MEPKEVTLKRGNCFIYSVLYKLHNPNAEIHIRWKKNRPSFYITHNGKFIYYISRKSTPSCFPIFEGRIIKSNHKLK